MIHQHDGRYRFLFGMGKDGIVGVGIKCLVMMASLARDAIDLGMDKLVFWPLGNQSETGVEVIHYGLADSR